MKLKQPVFSSLGLGLFAMWGTIVFDLALLQNHVAAQDQETITIMERIEKLAEAVGSYHAEVTTVTKENGKTSVIKGQAKFKWPNLYWQENQHPTKNGFRIGLIISNGKIQWNYMPSLNFAFKYDLNALDEDAREKGWIAADYFEEDSIQFLGREQMGKEEMYVFVGTQSALRRPEHFKHPGKARVYFSVKDGLPRKIVSYDHQGQETGSQTFSNIRKDASISAKDFEFTPPEGTRVHEVKDVGSRKKPSD